MPRKDLFHDVVKAALEADGWVITSDPYPLKFGEENLFIDLGADAPLAAEKEGRKIAVEIKSFTGRSPMTDLERALGQFTLYRFLLTRQDPERILYLAIDAETYQAVFNTADARDLATSLQLRIFTFDPTTERISAWLA